MQLVKYFFARAKIAKICRKTFSQRVPQDLKISRKTFKIRKELFHGDGGQLLHFRHLQVTNKQCS